MDKNGDGNVDKDELTVWLCAKLLTEFKPQMAEIDAGLCMLWEGLD